MPKDSEKHEISCPKCKNKFFIKFNKSDPKDEECSWEEHGEPRKTILSSIKRKTNRPMIASIFLICVFILGTTTALFSETFITSSMDIASQAGLTGTVEITITDLSNDTLGNINIEIDEKSGTTNENGIFTTKNVNLGIQSLKIKDNNYKNQSREILITPFFTTKSTIKLDEDSSNNMNISEYDSTGCTIIIIIFSIIALIGAISSYKRQHLDVAVVASLIGIFSFGFYFIGSILCIIALIIIVRAREEFEDGKKGKVF